MEDQMAVRSGTTTVRPADNPKTSESEEENSDTSATESEESDTNTTAEENPTQDPNSSSVSDTAVLPDAPYDEEEVEDLAVSLQRNGPFFMGNDVRSRESAMKAAKEILDAVIAMGWEKPSIKGETKEAIKSVYRTDEDPSNKETRKWEDRDVPTTEDRTRHRPQTGPTPSATSDVPGALQDNPAPTDAGGASPSTTSTTDPSKPGTVGRSKVEAGQEQEQQQKDEVERQAREQKEDRERNETQEQAQQRQRERESASEAETSHNP
jgi:hypothetical protein